MAAQFDKSDLIEFFLVEAGEHLQNLNAGLLTLEKEPDNRATIDELFRAAHTLKGSAAMMGLQGISDVAHKAEDMLGCFRSGSVPIQQNTLNFLFDAVDAVKLMVDALAAKEPEDQRLVESIIQSYEGIAGNAQDTSDALDLSLEEEAQEPPSQPPESLEPVTAPPAEETKDDVDIAWEQTFSVNSSPTPPAQEQAAPQPDASLGPLDELDMAWDRAFNIDDDAIVVEPLQVEPLEGEPPATEQPGAAPGASQEAGIVAESPVSAQPAEHIAAPPGREAVSKEGDAGAAGAPVGPPTDGGPLSQEIEEAKAASLREKRGTGRRATDVAEIEKQFIRVNIERLDNLMNLVGEMVVNRNRLVRQVEYIKTLREELAFSQKRLLTVIKNFEDKYEFTLNHQTPAAQSSGAPADAGGQGLDFFELEFDRYDDFNLLSRKLTEISNDTNEIMIELSHFFDTLELDTGRISTITTNLQDEITMARMVEMDKLFQLFQRPVRDLSQSEGKQVNMVITGGETKIDKTIFEIVSDPLMHMIRNSISHGIESPEDRTRLGKDPTGSLMLNARHEGNSIIIEIQDDGRGMDPAVIKKAAADKGFLNAAEAPSLSDTEAINLIFRPGFSTTASVGKISGRGVGMDVVSSQLARISGRIDIKTEVNVGTKFTIRLPLTLAIAHALIVKANEQEYAIPMNLVEETARFSFKEIQRVAGEEMVNLRDTMVRLVKLNSILAVEKFQKKSDDFRHPTLILGMAEKRLALMIEDITGREEIVVKSLGEYLEGLSLYSGATISGEGDVRLILNVATVFGEETPSAVTSIVATPEVKEAAVAPEAASGAMLKPRILVVDDSISIRKFVQRFLDRAGYEVAVAPDGVEALTAMGAEKFDVVITDLEMPVMHGYDLIAEMKRSPELKKIPVVVLTSRAGDKHRQKALEMGAQDYLVKPFDEQDMLGTLKKILSASALASRA
ncbi:MAG TPA: hypothetical protein DCO77_05020 [Nitrospiraceae bacterium]|nr:hypothetical protein [Nitrospiraceae bacterium]